MAILKIKDAQGKITEIPAIKGSDGVTPHIGANGNWFIGTTDTGVKAGGGGGATLIVNADEQMGHVSHTTEEIYNHYTSGGNVLLSIDGSDTHYQLIDADQSAAWFGGMVYDDGLGYRYLYTNDGVEEFESSWLGAYHNITGDHTHPNDVFYWDPDVQRTARGNLGLGEVIQMDDDLGFVRLSGSEINVNANTDQRNGGGAYLILGESPISMDDGRVAEVIEFWGNDHDEEVVLRRVAPGIEDFDAATMGQLRDTQAIVDDMNQDVADAYNNARDALSSVQSIGPAVSQVQTGLGALSALFDPELIQNGITAADEGKFLRVVNGKLTLVSIPNAEDGEF